VTLPTNSIDRQNQTHAATHTICGLCVPRRRCLIVPLSLRLRRESELQAFSCVLTLLTGSPEAYHHDTFLRYTSGGSELCWGGCPVEISILSSTPPSGKKINRSTHTHTPTENNTPDTDTHAHDKNNTPNPQTNTSHKHLTTLTPPSGTLFRWLRATPPTSS